MTARRHFRPSHRRPPDRKPYGDVPPTGWWIRAMMLIGAFAFVLSVVLATALNHLAVLQIRSGM